MVVVMQTIMVIRDPGTDADEIMAMMSTAMMIIPPRPPSLTAASNSTSSCWF